MEGGGGEVFLDEAEGRGGEGREGDAGCGWGAGFLGGGGCRGLWWRGGEVGGCCRLLFLEREAAVVSGFGGW